MKRILVPLLLVLALLCSGAALAEGNDEITLEVNEEKLTVYEAADPLVAELLAPDGEDLPVLVVPVKKGVKIPATIMPKTAKNRKILWNVENTDIARIQDGNTLSGRAVGETLLTISSDANPEVKKQYRVLVVTPASRIEATAPEKTVAAGAAMQLTAAVQPENAAIRQVTWSSADERIATVDENGVVTGVKRGSVRIVATALDGSNVRANISVQVTQTAQEITLDHAELTVDAGHSSMLKATVLPADTNDKGVLWSSTDESVATVNNSGRVTGVALGDCEIVCTSKTTGEVQARASVHVQQPVKNIIFDEAPIIYAGESGQLTWSIDPANASNPKIQLTSSNEKILRVSEDGTITALQAGTANINAVTTDGTNRRAKVQVRVLQHVTGVHMKRSIAYVDVKETATTGAILEPENASNKKLFWEVEDPSVATLKPLDKEPNRIKITGVSQGATIIYGTTEDGGYKTSLLVQIGDWDHALQLREAHVEGADVFMKVRNNSTLTITSITAEVSVFDNEGKAVPANSKDGSNTFTVVYRHTLNPGETTQDRYWKYVNFMLPDSPRTAEYQVVITQYQIDNDWVKVIRKNHRPKKDCPVHV